MNVDRASATVWAEWFRCLSDPSRILILNLLARAKKPMAVGEIVDQLDIGQSTVSHHLKVLADTCFVRVDREGTASYFNINERCLECFPSAAELIMGRLPRPGTSRQNRVPWSVDRQRASSASAGSRPPLRGPVKGRQ